jgi:hypothetical protein
LNIVQFEAALRDWDRQNLGDEEAIAIDAKGLLGIHGEELPGGELLAAYPQSVWCGTKGTQKLRKREN